MQLFGIDFTSAPGPRKPVVVASGRWTGQAVLLENIEALTSWTDFEAFLQRPGPWLGAFDFPFGLPREALIDLEWPLSWQNMVLHCRDMGRAHFKQALDRYRESRPFGQRYAHRQTDHPAHSHSPLKLVNPPVGLMFLEGAPRLLEAGVRIPLLHSGDPSRIAVEAYPGHLARAIETRSYKGDGKDANTPERLACRQRILQALQTGQPPLSIQLQLAPAHAIEVLNDTRGDKLDACLALLQAAWSASQPAPNYGLPDNTDPVEGWIATVPG